MGVARIIRWIARILLILWAVFWLCFNVASGFGELAEHGVGSLVNHLVVAGLIVTALLIVWRNELLGGIVLLALGVLGQVLFHPRANVAWSLTAPPVLVGLLLVAVRAWPRPGDPGPGPAGGAAR